MEPQKELPSIHERRRRKDHEQSVNFSQVRRPQPIRTNIGKRLSALMAQPTPPPETPLSPRTVQAHTEEQAVFHNYLRAFCHYDPPTNVDGSDQALLMTAPIRPGDLILVHSVHSNGWADGTVLTTGARGWLPTNYCESFNHAYMRSLLNALTQFWDLLGAGEDANLSTFVRQDYIRGLIAGVRSLLEHADCLHRDAELVQRSTGIRRMRKGLLADLSSLVQIAKKLQETIGEPYAGEVIHALIDDLLAKAFKVVTRAVGFVDMLAQEGADMKPLSGGKQNLQRSLTPMGSAGLGVDLNGSPRHDGRNPIDSAKHIPMDSAASFESMKAATEGTFTRASNTSSEPRSPTNFRSHGGITHRLSVIRKDHPRTGALASEQLAKAHDECISHIGAFIGLYLHSRPSSELVATTQRLVKACRTMLSIVDQVSWHDSQRRTSVQHARMNFQMKLDELTKSTKDVFKFSDGPDDDIVMLPEQTTHLVNVGTSLIRSVGECVVKTRKVIEQIGDFAVEQPQLETVEDDEQTVSGAEEGQRISESPKSTIDEGRVSKELPAPPSPLRQRAMTTTAVSDSAQPSPALTSDIVTPMTPYPATAHTSLPTPAKESTARLSPTLFADGDALKITRPPRTSSISPVRKISVGASISESTDTYPSSMRDSGVTAVSEVSTRATTPDHNKDSNSPNPGLINSFDSLSSLRSAAITDASGDAEAHLLQKTYANELTFNKDGQVTGGSLAALVEQLTTGDTAPDPQFVAAFFTTFRSFTTPRDLAQTLMDRFDYVGESKAVGTPVRLRIYNAFKGWLETYWNAEADKDSLGDIRYFAMHKLKPHLPPAGERLVDLTRRVASLYQNGTTTGPLVSGVGKNSMSIGQQSEDEGTVPEPNVSKSQLNTLRKAASGASNCSFLDFDDLELARQLTIMASKIFCDIQPSELLSVDWNNKNSNIASNVRRMCILNTDLAHVVGDSILAPDDAKKRALVIKHWSKVAMRCLEMNNYESLMAIMCSLNSSVVQRLKRTWEVISKKTRGRLDELNSVVDFSRNQASLRKRLERPVAPCLPFLGVYLTDLTFVDAGNPKLRELPGTSTESGEPISVINFDKHMRMAKIVSHIQKFQVPYNLKAVPEMQAWLQTLLEHMRDGHAQMVGQFHRRSLAIEPKRDFSKAPKMPGLPEGRKMSDFNIGGEDRPKTAHSVKTQTIKPHGPTFDFLLKTNFAFKSRHEQSPTPDPAEQR